MALNKNLIPVIVDDTIRVIECTYDTGPKPYTYMTRDKTIKPGDRAVTNPREGEYCVVEVKRVDVVPDTALGRRLKFIVGKIDTAQYEKDQAWADEQREAFNAEQFKRWREGLRNQLILAPVSADA